MRTRPGNNSIYLVLGLGYASILAKCVHNCAHVWRGNRTRVWQMCAQLCTRSVGGYAQAVLDRACELNESKLPSPAT